MACTNRATIRRFILRTADVYIDDYRLFCDLHFSVVEGKRGEIGGQELDN